MSDVEIPDPALEEAAKSVCYAQGLNPMTLCEKHGWPNDPPTDHTDERGRMYYYLWRKKLEIARAAINGCMKGWPGMEKQQFGRTGGPPYKLILPIQQKEEGR